MTSEQQEGMEMPNTKQSTTHQEKHQRARDLCHEGRPEEAVRLLDELLSEEHTTERWNDWATAQLLCDCGTEAEKGYRRALELDTQNSQAAANLGILLAARDRPKEAIPLLQQSLPGLGEQERTAVASVLTLITEDAKKGNEDGETST
jgi:Flp pilus assembly protein TadD